MQRHILTGNKEDIIKAIDSCIIGYKSKRNREIIKDHFIDGLTFEEAAEKFGLSVWQTKRICYMYEPIINSYISGTQT